MKRRASVTTLPTLNAETSLRCRRLRMKTTHLFTEERPEGMAIREINYDASPPVRRGAVAITGKESLEHEAPASHPRKVSSDESSDGCLSSSLIMQLASINIKEEKKSSTTSTTTPTKRGSLPLSFSKPLQARIKMVKRASAPPTCLTSKKRVHSRRRNRVVILNNKIMTKTLEKRGGSDSCVNFESISLGAIVTP